MAECAKGVYRPRRPRETPLHRLVEEHFERFEQVYSESCADRYGFFRPVIRETVSKYFNCGDLCRVAADVLVKSFRVLLATPQAEAGFVVCVHSFGNLLNFHPHLHVMATDGGFTPDGIFHPLPALSLAPIEELFRHRVLGMLRRKGLLTPERIKLLKSWEHSGFNVNAAVRIGASDATGRENLARYLIRAPFSMNKIRYDPVAGTVISKTKSDRRRAPQGAPGSRGLFRKNCG